jgi:5-methyltetrahydropteroyltriglutamate--homocysteine methyltransferase
MGEWLDLGVALDNQVMAGIDGVTFGLHLCRGNQASRWLVAGDYGPIAKPIFQRTAAHRLLLEYDDARSGGFEPLQHVPDDKMVVLGLITTKRGELENADELVARIEEASGYIDRERLALSPQCGFGTSIIGNQLTHDQQPRSCGWSAMWPQGSGAERAAIRSTCTARAGRGRGYQNHRQVMPVGLRAHALCTARH